MKPAKTYPFKPDWSLHPGELLREHLLENRLSQKDAATRLGRSYRMLSHIVNGRANLTADWAVALERILGPPAEYWMKLQANHSLFLARKKAKKR